jgi:hypothetical protein
VYITIRKNTVKRAPLWGTPELALISLKTAGLLAHNMSMKKHGSQAPLIPWTKEMSICLQVGEVWSTASWDVAY